MLEEYNGKIATNKEVEELQFELTQFVEESMKKNLGTRLIAITLIFHALALLELSTKSLPTVMHVVLNTITTSLLSRVPKKYRTAKLVKQNKFNDDYDDFMSDFHGNETKH